MLRWFTAVVLHLVMIALVCAICAYWAIRILAPAPANVPPAQAGSGPREADPVLAARMFGLVQATPMQTSVNVQAIGVFAAGPDSAAVLAVDGTPARVFLLNQEVAGGARLVAVDRNAVTIERGGVRHEILLPARETLNIGGSLTPSGVLREGNILSTQTADGTVQPMDAPVRAPLRPLQPEPAPPPPIESLRSRIRRQRRKCGRRRSR